MRKQLLREGALDALAAICDIAEDDATWDYASWAMHQIAKAEDEAQRRRAKNRGHVLRTTQHRAYRSQSRRYDRW